MQGVSASTNTNSPTGAGMMRRGQGEGRPGLVLEGSVGVLGPEVLCKALPREGTACAKHRHGENHSNLTEFSQLSGDVDFLLLWEVGGVGGRGRGKLCCWNKGFLALLCLLICFSLSFFSFSQVTLYLIVIIPGYSSRKSGNVASTLMLVFCTQHIPQFTSEAVP